MNLFRNIVAVSCLLLLACAAVRAHDGPEHEIEELTGRIKAEGANADLLLHRAIEYNVLGKFAEAAKDLERALDFEPDSAPIHRELGRAYFAAKKTNDALKALERGLSVSERGHERASLLIVRYDIYRALRDHKKALEDVDRAIRHYPEHAESYLARSQIHFQLGMKKERIKGLEDGIRETGSGLLEGELVDALIDAGKTNEALKKIEAELGSARLKAAWLIRRAKVNALLGDDGAAQADAKRALEELDRRINANPDPLLLADRGMAYELVGKQDEALKDYEKAREKGMFDEWVRERVHSIKEQKEKEKKDGKDKKDDKAKESRD